MYVPGYNSHTKVVPTETGGVESVLKTPEEILADEVFYASKAIRGMKSGFVCLQILEGNQWVPADEYSDAHFVCALFADRSHIPLPLLLPLAEEARRIYDPEWALQDRVILFATEAGLLDEAITACALQVMRSHSSHYEEELKRNAADWLATHS